MQDCFSIRDSVARSLRGFAAGRVIVWLTCWLMLPLPVPAMHRHDEMQSDESLEAHLADRHGEVVGESPLIDEPHWHFALPSQPSHDDYDHDHDREPDRSHHRPLLFVASHVVGQAFTSTQRSGSVDDFTPSLNSICDWVYQRHAHQASAHPSVQQAREALPGYRSALSCVMRC